TKDYWFNDLANRLTSNSDAETWVEGFAYFHKKATYDWQFTNVSGNANNNDLSCPTPSGSNYCWDGDNSTSTGWKDSFVTDSTSNHSHSAWFVGTSSATAPFRP